MIQGESHSQGNKHITTSRLKGNPKHENNVKGCSNLNIAMISE
jgi:hypothetical protein